jgi:hypothetical protein
MFKPGVANTNKEGKLAAWSSTSGINYIIIIIIIIVSYAY